MLCWRTTGAARRKIEDYEGRTVFMAVGAADLQCSTIDFPAMAHCQMQTGSGPVSQPLCGT